MKVRIGERGQVTIPKEFRERFNLKPNTDVEFIDDHGNLLLRRSEDPQKKNRWNRVRGILRNKVSNVDLDIEEMRGR